MSIINDFENYLEDWQPLIMLWGDKFRIIKKIKKFVKYDEDKLKFIYNTFKEVNKEN